MACGIVEIYKQAFEVFGGIPPAEGIYQRPYCQRDQHADGPAADELAGTVAQGEEQITRCNREKGHAATHQGVDE